MLDIFPPSRHKRSSERLALLSALRQDDAAIALGVATSKTLTGVDRIAFIRRRRDAGQAHYCRKASDKPRWTEPPARGVVIRGIERFDAMDRSVYERLAC